MVFLRLNMSCVFRVIVFYVYSPFSVYACAAASGIIKSGRNRISNEQSSSNRNQNRISEYLLHGKFFGFVSGMQIKSITPL